MVEIQHHQHRIQQVYQKKEIDFSKIILFFIGGYLMSTNDHDDEDFEEEPIKLWS